VRVMTRPRQCCNLAMGRSIEAAGNDDLPGISEDEKAEGAISTAPGSAQAPDEAVDRLLVILRRNVLRADAAGHQTPPAQSCGMLEDTTAIRLAETGTRNLVVLLASVQAATAQGHMIGLDDADKVDLSRSLRETLSAQRPTKRAAKFGEINVGGHVNLDHRAFPIVLLLQMVLKELDVVFAHGCRKQLAEICQCIVKVLRLANLLRVDNPAYPYFVDFMPVVLD
jgi:hypothetical protein